MTRDIGHGADQGHCKGEAFGKGEAIAVDPGNVSPDQNTNSNTLSNIHNIHGNVNIDIVPVQWVEDPRVKWEHICVTCHLPVEKMLKKNLGHLG